MGNAIILAMNNKQLSTTSIWCAGLLFPATLAISKVFELIIKSINPDEIVRVNQTLSYLSEILVFGMGIYTIIFASGLITGIMAYRAEKSDRAKLALKLLVAQAILTAVILLLMFAIKQLDM